jgi:hypothetical protein
MPALWARGPLPHTAVRLLTDLPVLGYPLVLRVVVPRSRCTTIDCGRTVFNQDRGKLAAAQAWTTRRCARYVLRRLMIDRTAVSAIAVEFGVSWPPWAQSRCARPPTWSRSQRRIGWSG